MRTERTRYAVSGWGTGTLWIEGGVVLAHEFVFDRRPEDVRDAPPGGRAGLHGDVVRRILAFFAGEDSLREVALDLSSSTPFQRAVTETLRKVPRGDVVTYGELAALAGYPNAHRAVGTCCARSRFALFVPCHRVVGADGLGSYGPAGIAIKRRLLALEGVAF